MKKKFELSFWIVMAIAAVVACIFFNHNFIYKDYDITISHNETLHIEKDGHYLQMKFEGEAPYLTLIDSKTGTLDVKEVKKIMKEYNAEQIYELIK